MKEMQEEIDTLRVSELTLVSVLMSQGNIDTYHKLLGEAINLRPWARKFLKLPRRKEE